MIERISSNIQLEEIPESKQFKVTMTTVDIADAENIVQNTEQIKNAIKSDEGQLQIKRDVIEKNIQQNKSLLVEFEKVEQTARLWKTEVELRNKRIGKENAE